MFRRFNSLFDSKLYSPDDAGVLEDKSLSKDEVIEILSGDDDEKGEILDLKDDKSDKSNDKEDKKEDKKEDETESEKELKDIEEELEEIDPDKLELSTPPRRRDILKKYPDVFKDFPGLEKAYYREQQFTELLPTIDDAREAVEKAGTLDKFEADLAKGDTERVLIGIKQTDPNAFNKVVDNYLEVLAKVDERAYTHVIGNVVKHTVKAMLSEGQSSKNEALEIAAQILHKFVFPGARNILEPSKLTKEEVKNEDLDKANAKEQELITNRFNESRDTLNTKINNSLTATIEANIDPKDSMSPYIKKNAIREAMESVVELMNKDSRFKQLNDKLWEAAKKSNFSKESIDRIKSAHISKARTLLPAVIKTARNEALKGMGKRVIEDKNDDSKDESRNTTRRSSASNSDRSGDKTKDGKIPQGMKTLDYLMQD